MKSKLSLLLFVIFLTENSFAAPPNEIGKKIFTSRCASCHNLNKVLVGPALAGVDQRHKIDWIIKFVQSSQTLIQSRDTAAVALFDKFNHTLMPDQPDLKAEDIQNIVAYIKEEAKASDAASKAPFARPSKLRPSYTPLTVSNWVFLVAVCLAIMLLVFAMLSFVRVKEYERNRQQHINAP